MTVCHQRVGTMAQVAMSMCRCHNARNHASRLDVRGRCGPRCERRLWWHPVITISAGERLLTTGAHVSPDPDLRTHAVSHQWHGR